MTALHQQIREAGRKFRLCEIGSESVVKRLLSDPSPYVRMLAKDRLNRPTKERGPYKALIPKNCYATAQELATVCNVKYERICRLAKKFEFVFDYRHLHFNQNQIKKIKDYIMIDTTDRLPYREAVKYAGLKPTYFGRKIKMFDIKPLKSGKDAFYLKADLDKMNKSTDGLLIAKQAIEYLGITENRFKYLKTRKKLEGIWTKNGKAYSKKSLDEWMAK